uniref:Uncharacterized protein n=1 Tax=Lygus hesperus TaxID=30085 RepID=A0A0A9YH34_LYGHE
MFLAQSYTSSTVLPPLPASRQTALMNMVLLLLSTYLAPVNHNTNYIGASGGQAARFSGPDGYHAELLNVLTNKIARQTTETALHTHLKLVLLKSSLSNVLCLINYIKTTTSAHVDTTASSGGNTAVTTMTAIKSETANNPASFPASGDNHKDSTDARQSSSPSPSSPTTTTAMLGVSNAKRQLGLVRCLVKEQLRLIKAVMESVLYIPSLPQFSATDLTSKRTRSIADVKDVVGLTCTSVIRDVMTITHAFPAELHDQLTMHGISEVLPFQVGYFITTLPPTLLRVKVF